MKIKALKVFKETLKLRKAYRTAFVDRVDSPVVNCLVSTDEGVDGVGQVTVSTPFYSPQHHTQEDIVAAIKRLAPKLEGMDPWDLAEIHRVMDKVTHGHFYAHSAVDVAIHDLLGKAVGIPVCRLLGGRLRTKVQVMKPLAYLSPSEMAAEARSAVNSGYRCLNLRGGRDLKEDLAILTAIREEVGWEIEIDIDFSQSLSLHHGRPDNAILYMQALQKYNIRTFEQPLAAWDFRGMSRICKAIETPVFADEAVQTKYDVLRIAEMGAADGFKVKMMKFGGLRGAVEVAIIAEAAGLSISVGNGLAGIIQNAAELHFAATLNFLRLPGEMVGFIHMRSDIGKGLQLIGDEVIVPEAAGLGIDLDIRTLGREC